MHRASIGPKKLLLSSKALEAVNRSWKKLLSVLGDKYKSAVPQEFSEVVVAIDYILNAL